MKKKNPYQEQQRGVSVYNKFSVQQGFTLIEILIALAIVAVGIGAALKATSLFSSNAHDLKVRLFADWAAQNRLAQYRLDKYFPDFGEKRYDCPMANEDFVCIETVSATDRPLIRRIEIRVVRPREERNDLARVVATLLREERQ